MKLLDKSEINKIKAAERKMEIDEGAKLARKIDSLRQLLAVEEKRLALFTSNMSETIKQATSEKKNELDRIEEAIATKKQISEQLDNEIALKRKQLD